MSKRPQARPPSRPVSRISMSLPEELLGELDRMVAQRGFDSRSQAISDMLHQFLVEHKRQRGDDIMVGTVTPVLRQLSRRTAEAAGELAVPPHR